MKARFLILFVVFFANAINSQNLTFTGKIADSKNGNAIQSAVKFISYKYRLYTKVWGYFENPKKYRRILQNQKFSGLFYKSFPSTIKINFQIPQRRFLLLKPSPIELDEVIVSTDRT
jgi:hypothetical protein